MKNLEKLDSSDRLILAAVQANGQISTAALADIAHVSQSSAQKRLRKLEREGYITGYYARLDPLGVDQTHLVYVQVKMADTTRKTLDAFCAAAREAPEILSIDMLTAGFDFLLKVRCRDIAAFAELHSDVISELPGVLQTLSFPVMKEVKDTTALPIEPAAPRSR